jgi:hypothetical protein
MMAGRGYGGFQGAFLWVHVLHRRQGREVSPVGVSLDECVDGKLTAQTQQQASLDQRAARTRSHGARTQLSRHAQRNIHKTVGALLCCLCLVANISFGSRAVAGAGDCSLCVTHVAMPFSLSPLNMHNPHAKPTQRSSASQPQHL